MAKKMKKKIRFKIIPILIFLIVSVFLYFSITFLINTKIKNIYIFDNELLSDQEIIKLAKIDNYPSFYKTFSKTIKNNIKKNSLIKDVKVKKKFFNVLEIYINEYKVLFIQKSINKMILENGNAINVIPDITVPLLLNEVPNTVYNSFINKINLVSSEIAKEISEIKYMPSEYDNSRFLLYMKDGNHVYINISKFDKLNYYNEIYPTLNNKKGTLYLDSGNHFKTFDKK